jgi:flagellar M-ring protein FliF
MNRFLDLLKRMGSAIKRGWLALTKTRRIVISVVAASLLLALIFLLVIFNRSEYEILYQNMSAEETAEVVAALQELGVSQVRTTATSIELPSNIIDNARMQLALQGFPKTTFNFDHWANSIDMFSTDSDRAQAAKQQLQYNIMAVLDEIEGVRKSNVIISLGEKDQYVLNSEKVVSSVSVQLTLEDGKSLNSDQMEGIYHFVLTSVPDLTMDKISIIDQFGVMLVPQDAPSGSEQLVIEQQRYKYQYELQNEISDLAKQKVNELLGEVIRATVSVNAKLDFGAETIEETLYTSPTEGNPAVTDPTRGGLVSNETERDAYGATASTAGAVGTTVDADIAPDDPTITYDPGADVYRDSENTVDYRINELKRQYVKDGFTVSDLTAGVFVDGEFTREELDNIESVIENAIGANEGSVSVMPYPFPPKSSSQTASNALVPDTTGRNTLIFIIVALGALLVILFFLAIMTSGSRKRRHVRARLAAQTAGGPSRSYEEEVFGQQAISRTVTDNDGDDALKSLMGEDTDTRQDLLKVEIKEFAKINPDIVAQLIRTWMKE